MHYYKPNSDYVTSTLNGALSNSSTSATIGTGLNIPATNGVLGLDYDSTAGLGNASGPETISYTSYNSSTGALTGITRGLQNTTAVTHNNGASVVSGPSTAYYQSVNYYESHVTGSNISISSNNTMTDGASVTVTASGRPFLVGCTAHLVNGVAAIALMGIQLVADGVSIPSSGDGKLEQGNAGVSFNDHTTMSFSTVWIPSGAGSKTVKFQAQGRNNAANFTGTILTGSNVWAIEL